MVHGMDVGLRAGDLSFGIGSVVTCCVTLVVLLTSLSLRNLPYKAGECEPWEGQKHPHPMPFKNRDSELVRY